MRVFQGEAVALVFITKLTGLYMPNPFALICPLRKAGSYLSKCRFLAS